MSKKQKIETPKFKYWLSAYQDCEEHRFIQIGNSFLLSKKVQDLSGCAFRFYICCCMECGGEAAFEFPRSAFKKYGIPTSSARRVINELVSKGFLKLKSGQATKENNRYVFSPEWKKGNVIIPSNGNCKITKPSVYGSLLNELNSCFETKFENCGLFRNSIDKIIENGVPPDTIKSQFYLIAKKFESENRKNLTLQEILKIKNFTNTN